MPGISPSIRCVTTRLGSLALAWKRSPQPAKATIEPSNRDSLRNVSFMVGVRSVDEEEEAQAQGRSPGEEGDVAGGDELARTARIAGVDGLAHVPGLGPYPAHA